MLRNTFVHIPGVGVTMERSLWGQGCLSWDHALGELDRFSFGTAALDAVRSHLEKSHEALESSDFAFFKRHLGSAEGWRAFPEFRDRCVYLDIETDGGRNGAAVTTIGLYDGKEFRALIKDKDLNEFPEIMAQYSMVVTFFGGGFDLPMLQKRFPSERFPQIHIDLCPTLRQLGIRGGLKKIEKQLGIHRGDDTDGLDGLDAIRLWRRYTALGDDQALETLIAYNREDVINLETLAEYAYKNLRKQAVAGSPLATLQTELAF